MADIDILQFGVREPVERGVLSLKINWASGIGQPRPVSRAQGLTIHPISGAGDASILYVSAALRF